MTPFLLAQIFVGISASIYAFSLIVKSKATLLLLQTISSVFFITQYFLLSAYIGAIVAILEAIRTITFYFIEKKYNTTKTRTITAGIFVVLGAISAIFTWQNWYSILPLLGLLAVSICLGFKNVLAIKISCIFSAICATLYLFFLNSIFGAICQIFIIIMGLIGLIYWSVKNKKQPIQNEDNLIKE